MLMSLSRGQCIVGYMSPHCHDRWDEVRCGYVHQSIRYIITTLVCALLTQAWPLKLGQHGGDTAGGVVVSRHETCITSLNYFQFPDIICRVWVPNYTGILHGWSDQCLIAQLLRFSRAVLYVTL